MRKFGLAAALITVFAFMAFNSTTSSTGNGNNNGGGNAPSSLTGKKLKTVRSYGEKEDYNFTSATAYSGLDTTGTAVSAGTYTNASGGDTSTVDMTEVTPTAGFENIYKVTWTSSTAGTFKLTRHVTATFTFDDSGTVVVAP